MVGVAGDHGNVDQVFKHWAADHQQFLTRLRRVALFYNHKVLRCLSCSFNNRPEYQAVFDSIDQRLHRPLLRAAFLNMILSYLLVSIADVTALKQIVFWGYQFTIICIESLAFVVAISLLEVLEWYVYRNQEPGYFKVKAKNVADSTAFGDND